MFKGILCDIGGVLYIGETPIKGASETIAFLEKTYPLRFLTNTTRTTPLTLYNKLKSMGFKIQKEHIFSALKASKEYLLQNQATIYPLLSSEAKEYMQEFISDTPDFVLVGDAYTNFSYKHMNEAFRHLLNGAKLLAAAKNKYFKDRDEKLSLDAGAFIVALEYASNTKAKLIGKPNKEFFLLACKDMKLNPDEVLMIGDDIESDIIGAKEAGLQTALVQTGKFRNEDLKKEIKPDFLLKDITQIVTIL